jgi:hypothetical protein
MKFFTLRYMYPFGSKRAEQIEQRRAVEAARQAARVAELKEAAQSPQWPYPMDEFDTTTAEDFLGPDR